MPKHKHITAEQRVKLTARQIQRFNAENEQRAVPWPTSKHLTGEDIGYAQILDTEPHVFKIDNEEMFPPNCVSKPTSLATTLRHWRLTVRNMNEKEEVVANDDSIAVEGDTGRDYPRQLSVGQGELDGSHSKTKFRFKLPLKIIPLEDMKQCNTATLYDLDAKADHEETIDVTHNKKSNINVRHDTLNQSNKSNNGPEQEFSGHKDEYKKVINQLYGLSVDYNHLRHELAVGKRENTGLRDELEILQHQINELQKENDGLREDITAQKENLVFAKSARDHQSERVTEVDFSRDILDRLRRDLRAKRREKQGRRRSMIQF